MTKEMRPTSMASSAQPGPEMPRSLPWARVKGRFSRRSLRVGAALRSVAGAAALVRGESVDTGREEDTVVGRFLSVRRNAGELVLYSV